MSQDPYPASGNGGQHDPAAAYPDPYATSPTYPAYPSAAPQSSAGRVEPYSNYAPTGFQAGGYGGVLPPHPNATLVLVLGIIGIVGASIAGPFAWFYGNKARRDIRQNPGRYREDGALTAGWILGILSTIMLAVGVLVGVFWILFAVAFATMH